MKISIFGLGYVGTVSAGCLAQEGHQIIGVDAYQTKVDLINQGKTPVIEKDIGDIIHRAVHEKGNLRATLDVEEAVNESEISLICVGTPSQLNGSLDLKYVRHVCEQIGKALQRSEHFHTVVIRSTMLPGSMKSIVIPTLEESSKKQAGVDFGVCNNPEFLREGSAVYDFFNPPKTVIGEMEDKSGERVASLYKHMNAPLIRTSLETSEMVKYSDNVWHALKICFANEIGNICKSLNIDGHQVMEIFCQDTKLNLSPYYMKPGFAFGGSCLPKDVRALTYKAQSLDLDVPVLRSIMSSNEKQIDIGLKMIMEKGNKKIGVLGFSFKAGTDDLRESPIVEIIERLLGKGYDVKIYDRNVNIASLVGGNRDYILNQIPHISRLMVSNIEEVLEHAKTIVIGNGADEFKSIVEQIHQDQEVVDFVRIKDSLTSKNGYDGICW
jgi:GDP-mannose 6-dehydrogenase